MHRMDVRTWAGRMPWSIPLTAITLMLIGWLAIARAENLLGLAGRYVDRQMVFSGVAAAAMLLVTVVNYRVLMRWAYAIFAATLLLLVVVYFFPPINYAQRWIRVGPLSLQPSELAKVGFVLALARYLMHRESYRRLPGLLPPMVIALLPIALILPEPDLGTSLVFLPVLLAMLFAAGARRIDLVAVVAVGIVLLPVLWLGMSTEQRSRVTALFDQPPPGVRPSDDAYHLYQAKRVRAMGGWWGSAIAGEATEDRAVYRLPHAHSDFIFSVIGERYGLPGMGMVLALYLFLIGRVLMVAAATREPFGRLIAAGVAALFAVEVLINTGMTVGLLPITGLSLPLVSYGGSGLLAHALAVGLVLNVVQHPSYEVGPEPFRYAVTH